MLDRVVNAMGAIGETERLRVKVAAAFDANDAAEGAFRCECAKDVDEIPNLGLHIVMAL